MVEVDGSGCPWSREQRPVSLSFPATRWSLIGRLGQTPEATSILLELYFDSIGRYVRHRFPEESRTGELDDVIQEVAIHVMERPDLLVAARPGMGSRFRYLLMTVAYNAARNALRTRRRRRGKDIQAPDPTEAIATSLSESPIDESSPQVGAAMDRAWAESVLDQAWNDLRAWTDQGLLEVECIPVLEHSLLTGLSVRDMAPIMGLSSATCQRRLARGRTFLQRAIVDHLIQAGELPATADPARACEVMLGLLRPV